MSSSTTPETYAGREPAASLAYTVKNRRTAFDALLTFIAILFSVVAMLPLFSVLYMLMARGVSMLSLELFTELTPGGGMEGGGIGNAVVGTLVVVAIATVVSLPLGFLSAVYLAEYGGDSKLASTVRFAGKVLTGMPSILAGVFAYALVVATLGSFSALAGGIALGLLMVPVIMLTAEQALRMVPEKMKLAAFGMGATRAQVVLRVVVPTAGPAILTGVMLALARAMGETAPLLFTALFNDYWFDGKVVEPIASLAVLIYNFSGSPFENQVQLAWAGSLVLVSLVLVLNVTAQLIMKRPEEH